MNTYNILQSTCEMLQSPPLSRSQAGRSIQVMNVRKTGWECNKSGILEGVATVTKKKRTTSTL